MKIHGHIFLWINDWLLEGDFKTVDLLLEALKAPLVLSDRTLLVLLSATLAAAPKLEKRAAFYQRVETEFNKRHGPERSERLLQGLKGKPSE